MKLKKKKKTIVTNALKKCNDKLLIKEQNFSSQELKYESKYRSMKLYATTQI